MRITVRESNAIARLAIEILSPFAITKLFGSRVNDQKRGGDIDLLIIVPKDQLQVAKARKFQFIDALQGAIGEQRIDVVITTEELLEQDPFLSSLECIDLCL